MGSTQSIDYLGHCRSREPSLTVGLLPLRALSSVGGDEGNVSGSKDEEATEIEAIAVV